MRNPLDPNAWLTEQHRFDAAGETADIRLGVHAADKFETALAYAVHKASQEGGPNNCGIIFELNMNGLEPLPEGDAIIVSRDERIVINNMVEQIQDLSDPDDIRDYLEEAASWVNAEYQYEWFSDFWVEYVWDQSPWVIIPALDALDDDELVATVAAAIEEEGFDLELWAEAIGQWRYMAPVGFNRVLRVWAVQPVAPQVGLDEDDFEDDGLFHPTVDDLVPDTILLYNSNRRVKEPMYHGTDITRARRAFPELLGVLRNPWDYGQPPGVGPA